MSETVRQCKSHWIHAINLILGESLLAIKLYLITISNYDVIVDPAHFFCLSGSNPSKNIMQDLLKKIVGILHDSQMGSCMVLEPESCMILEEGSSLIYGRNPARSTHRFL